ncbi:MAG TPA: hypothetical protein ENK57_23740 [Polyangiaceae bacterium]|nr:hypothetical protein [Polyangiaceae bacterium]
MANAGHRSGPSEHAGGYVCNELYYRLLHTGRPSLFIHVPDDIDPRRLAAPLALGIARAVIAWSRDVPR